MVSEINEAEVNGLSAHAVNDLANLALREKKLYIFIKNKKKSRRSDLHHLHSHITDGNQSHDFHHPDSYIINNNQSHMTSILYTRHCIPLLR